MAKDSIMSLWVENEADYRQLLTEIDVPLITELIPLKLIKSVIQECHVQEKRRRCLPAWLMVLLCIMRGIFAQEAFSSVFARLCFVPCLQSGFPLTALPDKSALCLARYRLGARPLALLFKRICHPIATPQTPGAFAFGYRLVAIDSTKETVADTPANADYFGRHRTRKGRDDSAFPLFQALYLCECSTHVIFDAAITPFKVDHYDYFRRLLRSVDATMLVMFDRGFIGYHSLKAICDCQAQALAPVKKDMKLRPQKYLADGTSIAHLRSWANGGANDDPPLPVRVITYTIDDPQRNPQQLSFRLITTLLDPELYPAATLIKLYHQRWDIEIAIDEIDTHQRFTWTPFRSQKPVGVIQEFYALLLAYFIIRSVMHRSAEVLDDTSQRLSFINALRLIQHVIPVTQLLWGTHYHRLIELFHQWQQYFRLPPRDHRINPRVVKRKQSKFRRKKPEHISIKVQPFAHVIRLCGA
jgi:hypothetical protein